MHAFGARGNGRICPHLQLIGALKGLAACGAALTLAISCTGFASRNSCRSACGSCSPCQVHRRPPSSSIVKGLRQRNYLVLGNLQSSCTHPSSHAHCLPIHTPTCLLPQPGASNALEGRKAIPGTASLRSGFTQDQSATAPARPI